MAGVLLEVVVLDDEDTTHRPSGPNLELEVVVLCDQGATYLRLGLGYLGTCERVKRDQIVWHLFGAG